jgi:hypothetical protein
MFNLIRSRSRRRRGLTNVVTTLILLTFGVLLALTATSFTSGLTRARVKSAGQENVRFYKTHVWVEGLSNGTDWGVAAFRLHNLGGKSTSVEFIDLRGWEIDWLDVYSHTVNKTSEPTLLYRDLIPVSWDSLTGSSVTIDGYDYTQATGSIHFGSGATIIVYIKMPPMIYRDNIGQPVAVAIGTVNANFFTEIVAESHD